MKISIVNKTVLVLVGAFVFTSCVSLSKTPALEVEKFTQQELNEARRIRPDAPYLYGIVSNDHFQSSQRPD